MKLAYRRLGINAQIWSILELLGEDFTFFDLSRDMTGEQEKDLTAKYDVNTYVFNGQQGVPTGFLLRLKGFMHEQALYVSITHHSSGDFPVVMDWIVGEPDKSFDYRNPPITAKDRPEDARTAHFGYGDTGMVVEYIRQLFYFYMTGKKSDPRVARMVFYEGSAYAKA